MDYFFSVLRALPDSAVEADSILINGESIIPLQVDPADLATPMMVTFEDAFSEFEKLERMH